jgi:hypothetical protein
VPLEPWTFTWYRKFETPGSNEPGGSILFIIRNQKDILTDIRVIYAGKSILREKNSETMLEGKQLPLDRRDAEAFLEKWKNYLSGFSGGNEKFVFGRNARFTNVELVKAQILNFIETTVMNISD